MDAKTVQNAKTAGIGVAAVAVLGVGGYVLYKVLGPVGDAAKAAAEAARKAVEDAGKVATNATGAVANASQILPVAGALFYPASVPGQDRSVTQTVQGFGELRLEIQKEGLDNWFEDHLRARIQVFDRKTGAKVPADVRFHAKFAPLGALYPDRTFYFNGYDALVIDLKTVNNPLGQAAAFEVSAEAPGYNATGIYTVD